MAEVRIDSLEPNSHKYKAEKEQKEETTKNRERISPVVNRDRVISTKKPLGKRISETFLKEDSTDIKNWFLWDVLIPGIQNSILDMLSMAFFGELSSKDRRYSSRGRRDRTDYRSYYKSSYESRSRRDREDRYDSDDRVDFRNIVLRYREDAEHVIEEMRKRIRDYDSVSVADLLDLVDVPGRYTDNNYGWTDERDIGIRRVSSGYLIDVSEPRYLN